MNAAAGLNRIKGIIFDMDGLLLDTESLYLKVGKEQIEKLGGYLEDRIYHITLGTNHRRTREIYREKLGPDFPLEEWEKAVYLALYQHFTTQGVDQKPGAGELLRTLQNRGLKIALATSSARRDAETLLALSGLEGYFSAVVCGDEISRGKPEPDIFLAAAAKLNLPPPACLVLEDSYAGIRGAEAAGMRPIMVPDLVPPDEDIRRRAFRVCASLIEVESSLDELLE
ncbi:MAG: HAD family phosphatase [Spirochaetales bacterium]|jgi:HAD superfamily hydrolase (TIGR01509 family)|nr:HAD family phosphatase [Spirochaetales bacterium]